jgi:TetR/AcrR family transcriptional repressor of nem operon
MKVSRTRAAQHRQALLEQGGRLLRRRGIGGVGIADIARAAGLTHGAFYGHFASKTALVAETVATSLALAAQRWRDRAARARSACAGEGPCSGAGLSAIIAAYLTEHHRDAPEAGCALAALGPEVSRPEVSRPEVSRPESGEGASPDHGLQSAESPMAAALRTGSAALVAALADEVGAIHPTLPPVEREARAMAILATLTGGLVLARALAGDAEASRAALATAARLARVAADTRQHSV